MISLNVTGPLLFTGSLLALAPALALAGACNHNVYTPPARAFAVTSPQVLQPGETAARGTISSSSQLFGPEIFAATAGVRRGAHEDLEVVGDASFAKVNEGTAAGTNRNIAMGRIGAKVNPTESPNLAVTAGVGGGYAPASGMYASADVGVVVGYENRYLVPFASFGAFASVPIDPKEVDTTQPSDSEQHVDTPEKTQGLTIGVGLKRPFETSALFVGITWTKVRDNDSEDEFMSIGVGVEAGF